MKKLIRAFSDTRLKFDKQFGHDLFSALKQFLPKNCKPSLNSRYDEITLSNVPSFRTLVDKIDESLEALGYDDREIECDPAEEYADIYVADGDQVLSLTMEYDHDDMSTVYIDVDYKHQGPRYTIDIER